MFFFFLFCHGVGSPFCIFRLIFSRVLQYAESEALYPSTGAGIQCGYHVYISQFTPWFQVDFCQQNFNQQSVKSNLHIKEYF